MPMAPTATLDENVNDGERQGGRVALRWELTDNIVVTPRVIYQDIDFNGYNRQDAFNILANPFTTTQPRVDIGEREQYRQLDEHFDDDFFLGDLTMEFDFGPAVLTSVSSYTDRDILVTRDASQLTGSVTFDILGEVDGVRLDSPLLDYTTVEVFTQELRLSSDNESRFQWVVGGFYSDIERDYGQTLPTPGYDCAHRRAEQRGSARRRTRRSSRAFRTTSSRRRSSPRARSTSPSASAARSARVTTTSPRTATSISAACSPTATACRPSRATARAPRTTTACCRACCSRTTSRTTCS